MKMHARTANPLAILSLLVVMLVSGLAACGRSASTAPAIGPAAAPQHASADSRVPDEGQRALQRVSHAPTSGCDDGTRAAARMGIIVTCRGDQGTHLSPQQVFSR